MWKKIWISLVAIVVLVLAGVGYFAYTWMPGSDQVLDFITDHPERSAVMWQRNDSAMAVLHPDRVMPLASTVKIIIAIEYAAQAAAGRIDPNETVDLDELAHYYVPGTDGGAHLAWQQSLPSDNGGKVAMRQVAGGMIQYSSNANSEWLLDRLGFEAVNARLDSLGVRPHTPIYPFVSALFVGRELFPDKEGGELVSALEALDERAYIEATYRIHAKMKADRSYRQSLGDLGMDLQRIWSDRLPASTVAAYAALMQKINSRKHFTPEVHTYLNEVMEQMMDHPANQSWLQHSGMKGGSTATVLTKAMYATDKAGNKTELAYFLNDLSLLEALKLQMSMNAFELELLQNAAFRKKAQAAFTSE